MSSIGIQVCVSGSEKFIRFHYTTTFYSTGEKESFDYKARITSTPCYFGGERYWFVCPLSRDGVACNRRVGVLYLPSGGSYYGCRHCYDLAYESQQRSGGRFQSTFGRVFDLDEKADKLHEKIGGRYWYAGRLTRNARKLARIRQQQMAIGEIIERTDFLH